MSEKEVRKMCNSLSLVTTQWKMAVAQGRLIISYTTCVCLFFVLLVILGCVFMKLFKNVIR